MTVLFYFSLATDDALRLVEEIDARGDVAMGFPATGNVSDGDSDNSNEENEGSSALLNRQFLAAPAEINIEEDHSDEDIVLEPPKKKSKNKFQRKWDKKIENPLPSNVAKNLFQKKPPMQRTQRRFSSFFDEGFIKLIS